MDDLYIELAVAVLGAGGVGTLGLKYLIDQMRERKKRSQRAAHVDGLSKISEIYDCLNQLVASNPNINRVMVIRSSNSGTIPKPGCRIFIRIIHEAYRRLDDSIVHSNLWDERQADQHYIELVRDIAIRDTVLLKTEDLPEDSALRSVYQASGTTHSAVYRLRLSGNEMIYLSINYTDPVADGGEDPAVRALRENIVSTLRTLFHE